MHTSFLESQISLLFFFECGVKVPLLNEIVYFLSLFKSEDMGGLGYFDKVCFFIFVLGHD